VGSDSLAAEFGSFMTTFPDLFFLNLPSLKVVRPEIGGITLAG